MFFPRNLLLILICFIAILKFFLLFASLFWLLYFSVLLFTSYVCRGHAHIFLHSFSLLEVQRAQKLATPKGPDCLFPLPQVGLSPDPPSKDLYKRQDPASPSSHTALTPYYILSHLPRAVIKRGFSASRSVRVFLELKSSKKVHIERVDR